MEELDRELQRRVWSRVQSRGDTGMPALKQSDIKALLYPIQENSAVYLQLGKLLPGKDGEKLRRLYQEAQKCIACIKGICRLRGEQIKLRPLTPPRDTYRRALEKCYHRERQLCAEWDRRSADPEHGVVFGRLCQQAREHCVTLLEILGGEDPDGK